jgi:hypothetical protein
MAATPESLRTRHPVTGPAQALQGTGAVALVDDHADAPASPVRRPRARRLVR